MNRRNAIRNGIMALCASLLPKILQPIDGGDFFNKEPLVSKEFEGGKSKWYLMDEYGKTGKMGHFVWTDRSKSKVKFITFNNNNS